MNNNFKYRKVSPEDFERIVELDNKYSEEHPEEDEFTIEELKEYYENNEDFIWVSENKNNIIGFIVAFSDQKDKVGHLEMIFVHPNFRRRGIASELVNRVLREYRKNNIEKVFVLAPKENGGLLKFYKNIDFDLKAYYMSKNIE